MGIDACEVLAAFRNEAYVPLPKIDLQYDTLHACLQGANIAKALILWCELLRWPPDV